MQPDATADTLTHTALHCTLRRGFRAPAPTQSLAIASQSLFWLCAHRVGWVSLLDQSVVFQPSSSLPHVCGIRELSEDALQPVSYTGEGPGGSTYCVNMARIIRHKRLLVRHCNFCQV